MGLFRAFSVIPCFPVVTSLSVAAVAVDFRGLVEHFRFLVALLFTANTGGEHKREETECSGLFHGKEWSPLFPRPAGRLQPECPLLGPDLLRARLQSTAISRMASRNSSIVTPSAVLWRSAAGSASACRA